MASFTIEWEKKEKIKEFFYLKKDIYNVLVALSGYNCALLMKFIIDCLFNKWCHSQNANERTCKSPQCTCLIQPAES